MLPLDPMHLLMGSGSMGVVESASPTTMPAATTVCRCNGVTKGDLVHAWDGGATTVEALASATLATTGCGGCKKLVCGIVDWLQETDPPEISQPATPAVRQPFRRGNTETPDMKSALPNVRTMTAKKKLAVVGAGMVAHRLVEAMVERDADERLGHRRSSARRPRLPTTGWR